MTVDIFSANQIIITKGEKGDCMYVIFEGNVRVHDEDLEIAKLGKGNFFGEFSLLDEEPRSMSVTTVIETVIGRIFQYDFYEVLNKHPEVTKDVMKTLIKRLRSQNGRIIRQMKEREQELEKLVKERTTEVIQQKELVETKNKEILDSITYAKRLQEAILPLTGLNEKIFPESFVLYLPKDIVSGDFYWLKTSDSNAIVIAADCTGHGVSGALMSMLGVSLLNQIVNEKIITDPAAILNHLHTSVIEALQQNTNHTHDGMDIAVCSFDFEKKIVQFAGANRPLWLGRKGEFQIITPDKMPIGGLQTEQEKLFTNHVVALESGDMLYIFTDGYADQFGGINGKKLFTKKFREMLKDIMQLKAAVQKKYLIDFFEKWKGVHEQVDDVLIIGIRV